VPANFGTFSSSAQQTNVAANLTASSFSFNGTTNFTQIITTKLTATSGDINFNGNVLVAAALNLTLQGNNAKVNLEQGVWSQGNKNLTFTQSGSNTNSFHIGGFGFAAVFNMTGGTIQFTGGSNFGSISVDSQGSFEVGAKGGPAGAEMVTVDNGTGNIFFNAGSTLEVGMASGAHGTGFVDELAKKAGATGNIVIEDGTRLIGAALNGNGLAPTTPATVLDAAAGMVEGFFDLTVDPNNHFASHAFLMGSDIALAGYNPSTLTVVSAGTVSPGGVFSTFNADGDKLTVTASGGTAAGLVINQDVNGDYDIVFRNASAATNTLTLSTSATPGSGFTTDIAGISVDGPGAVAIGAGTIDLGDPVLGIGGEVRVQNLLTGLTLHDANDFNPTVNPNGANALILAGGTSSQATTIAGRLFANVDIQIGSVLSTLTVRQYMLTNSDPAQTIEAARLGIITVAGMPSMGILGNLDGTLINTANSTLPAVSAVTVAGTLSGAWDLTGSVGTVTAKLTDQWNLGQAPGANANGSVTNVTSLSLGVVTQSDILATGNIAALTAISWNGAPSTSDTIEARSFGTIAITGNASLGNVGDMVNVSLIALGNSAGTALTSLTVAGNLDSQGFAGLTSLTFDNGNVGSIIVGRTVGLTDGVNFTAATSPTSGVITLIQAACWAGLSTVNARSVGTFTITGSSVLLGDFLGTITLQGTAGSTGSALGTFLVAHDVQDPSTITIDNGGIGSFTVGVSIDSLNLSVLGGAGGTIGTLTAAEWTDGGSFTALAIGTLKITGLALPNASGTFLAGDLAGVNMNFFRNSGTGLAIGTLSVAGSLSLSNGYLRADNGIGTFFVGRDVSGTGASIIHVDNPSASITAVTAGRWGYLGAVDVSASSIGAVTIKGYRAREQGTTNFSPGDFDNTTVFVGGQSPSTHVGINSFIINGDLNSDYLDVPFGITTVSVAGSISGSRFQERNPLTAGSGRIGVLVAGEIDDTYIQANAIGTLKTTGNSALFPYSSLQGDFDGSDVTTTALLGTGLGTFSVAGNMLGSSMNVRGSVTTFTVAQLLSGSEVAAGFNGSNQIGTLTAASIDNLQLVTNSLITLNVPGNTALAIPGAISDSLFTVTGKVASVNFVTVTTTSMGTSTSTVTYTNVGIGIVTVAGTVSNTDFNVFSGNVVSVTVGAFTSSALLVGFHAVAANDININPPVGPLTSGWNATNFALSSFKTTGPLVNPTSPPQAGTFTDSLVVAAKLGTITLPGIDTVLPLGSDTIAFGIGFRTTGGAKGTVTVEGKLRNPGASINGLFFYRGLAG